MQQAASFQEVARAECPATSGHSEVAKASGEQQRHPQKKISEEVRKRIAEATTE